MSFNVIPGLTPSPLGPSFEDLSRVNSRQVISSPSPVSSFRKMIVLDVLFDPNDPNNITDVNDRKKMHFTAMNISNIELMDVVPRNTIIAKIANSHERPMFVFPFFPSHLALPCKVGEMVWVIFDEPSAAISKIAYWMCKVVMPHHVDDVNHTHAARVFEPSMYKGTRDLGNSEPIYELRAAPVVQSDGERATSALLPIIPGYEEDIFETLIFESDAGMLTVYEHVPRYRKRPGDIAIEGSNNSLIVLGTDRHGPVAEYIDPPGTLPEYIKKLRTKVPAFPADKQELKSPDLKEFSGTIDMVVGRGQTEKTSGKSASTTSIKDASAGSVGSKLKKEVDKSRDNMAPGEGDPDFKNDRSRILISQRTKVDTNFKLKSHNEDNDKMNTSRAPLKDAEAGDAAIVIKTDKIRMIARSDIQLVVTNFVEQPVLNAAEPIAGQPPGPQIKIKLDEEKPDPKKWASVTIKVNGDIIVKPSEKGVVKLGGEDADLAVLCIKAATGATDNTGKVTAPTIVDTAAGEQGGKGGRNGQFATKVLLK